MSDRNEDRELLEAAAKAAGYELCQWPDEDFVRAHMGGDWRPKWNPLTDDGDALRLAVKLNINIEHMETLKREPYGINCWPVGRGDCAGVETDLRDPYAATRRAIVRAAAELGGTQ